MGVKFLTQQRVPLITKYICLTLIERRPDDVCNKCCFYRCTLPCMYDEWGSDCTQDCGCSDDQDCEPISGRCFNPDGKIINERQCFVISSFGFNQVVSDVIYTKTYR